MDLETKKFLEGTHTKYGAEMYGDFVTSVERAMGEIDKNWRNYNCLIIAGSHNPKNTDFLIGKIKEARETGRPYYGECFGFQLSFIEYARNVIGIRDATSEEFGEKGTFVVRKRREGLNVGLHNGESYWNNYQVDSYLAEQWEIPQNFFIAQYHASYNSSIFKPHKLIKSFLHLCKKWS